MIEVAEIAKLAAEFCEKVEAEIDGTALIVGTVVIVCDLADEDGSTRIEVSSSDKRDWVIAGLLDRAAQEHALEVVEETEEEDEEP